MSGSIQYETLKIHCDTLSIQLEATVTMNSALLKERDEMLEIIRRLQEGSGKCPHRKIRTLLPRPDDGIIFAICEDGTVWYRGYFYEADCEWVGLPVIPGGKIKTGMSRVPHPNVNSMTPPPPPPNNDNAFDDDREVHLSDNDPTMIHDVQAYHVKGEGPSDG